MSKRESMEKKITKLSETVAKTSQEIDEVQAEINRFKSEDKPVPGRLTKKLETLTKKNTDAAAKLDEAQVKLAEMPESTGGSRSSSKEPNPEIFKPVVRGGIRHKVAVRLMEGATFKEIAAELGSTESNARTHLHNMVVYNGFGYTNEGGKVTLLVPEGQDMFVDKVVKETKKAAEETEPAAE